MPRPRHDELLNKMFLKITTYNVGELGYPLKAGGREEAEGHFSKDVLAARRAFNEVIHNLETLRSDIFLLQEISDYETLDKVRKHLSNGDEYEAHLVTNSEDVEGKNVGLLTRITPTGPITFLQADAQEEASGQELRLKRSLVCEIPLPHGRILTLISPHLASSYGHYIEHYREERFAEAKVLASKIKQIKREDKLIVVAGTLNDIDPECPGYSIPFYHHPRVLWPVKGNILKNAASMDNSLREIYYTNKYEHVTDHFLVDKDLTVNYFSVHNFGDGESVHYPVSAIIQTRCSND